MGWPSSNTTDRSVVGIARQVQRYVLLTTLARYDSALVPRPYLARDWGWSHDRRALTLRIEAALSSVLLPIAMFEGAIGLDRTLNGIAAERVFEESSVPEP